VRVRNMPSKQATDGSSDDELIVAVAEQPAIDTT
jgi:hypothetical protein